MPQKKGNYNYIINIEGNAPVMKDLGDGAWGWYKCAQGRLEVFDREGEMTVTAKVQVGDSYHLRANKYSMRLDPMELPQSPGGKLGHLLGCNRKRRASIRGDLSKIVKPGTKTRRVSGQKFELVEAHEADENWRIYAVWIDDGIGPEEIKKLIPYMKAYGEAYNKAWLSQYFGIDDG